MYTPKHYLVASSKYYVAMHEVHYIADSEQVEHLVKSHSKWKNKQNQFYRIMILWYII